MEHKEKAANPVHVASKSKTAPKPATSKPPHKNTPQIAKDLGEFGN